MKTKLHLLFGAAGLALLGACAKQESAREIDWAKSALARNPAYEILATDERTGVFTVRDTTTGEVQTLRLEQLVAAPLPPKPAKTAVAATAPESLPEVQAEPAAPLADNQTTDTALAIRADDGTALASGPGYSITKGEAPANGATTLEGPGYTITRQEPHKRKNTPPPETVASNVEQRTDPIICQGDRLMRIDGEVLDFAGDAFIAERGCDLYISNARIRAGGVGIIARQARVHIVNSTIGGIRGSYEASEGAEIYVARSTFTGVGRRFDSATMNDLGGNEYQTH
jgi:hypothetical protein